MQLIDADPIVYVSVTNDLLDESKIAFQSCAMIDTQTAGFETGSEK